MHFLVILILYAVYAKTQPIANDSGNVELLGGGYEGDLILNLEQMQLLKQSHPVDWKSRNGHSDMRYRWPNKTVYYNISTKFLPIEISQIRRAMRHIEIHTCIRFEAAAPNMEAFVLISHSLMGCNSEVGYQGRVQHIRLMRSLAGVSCFRFGSIVHELLHTLGFYHQQSTPDRDQYVRINYENILHGSEHNFQKYAEGFVSDFGISYDYASIMHYGPYAFSWNGRPTIERLHSKSTAIGQRFGLSAKDIQKIKKMYSC
ncbi:seminal metalloprotease 1-like [Teleopsis dalmanni]|uniref:seminal metalloprotease 1-like n=1 Tax=Teleopsis dalmanni TaxID=139649 RepID=UPI0018CF897A|nr:seminal metalloprotease 1-like [Teleopsis dalmanni]